VLLDELLGLGQLLGLEAEVGRQFHAWLDPELRFAVRVLNMNVRAPLFSREKVESKPLDSKNGRTHRNSIAQRADVIEPA
jgi:hypothetical protein